MQPNPYTTRPFDALDADWAIECRRHRRSDVLARWAEQEPALAGIDRLADLVPPAGAEVDRAPICDAIARIHATGDDLAGRALLQVLVPGLLRLTASWARRLDGTTSDAGWEIISRSQTYISRLRGRDAPVRNPAVYVLWCVCRDLITDDQQYKQERVAQAEVTRTEPDWLASHPSAEAEASEQLIYDALQQSADRGYIPHEAVEALWKMLSGYSGPEASAATGFPLSSLYRHRDRALNHLRRHVTDPARQAGEEVA